MSNLTVIVAWVENRHSAGSFVWTCPFCARDATIGTSNRSIDTTELRGSASAKDTYVSTSVFVRCPNPKCRRVALYVLLHAMARNINGVVTDSKRLDAWQLVPASEAKQFPDYIPEQILRDYEEACMIADLSPRASATLSRRCLQGMIRDFHGVTKRTLYDEIEGIKDKVDTLTWEAIDAVRTVGNIGAHMEKDPNVIVDVETDEADMLIGLIESLLEEWYVARHDRQKRMQGLVALGESKKQAKKGENTAG